MNPTNGGPPCFLRFFCVIPSEISDILVRVVLGILREFAVICRKFCGVAFRFVGAWAIIDFAKEILCVFAFETVLKWTVVSIVNLGEFWSPWSAQLDYYGVYRGRYYS